MNGRDDGPAQRWEDNCSMSWGVSGTDGSQDALEARREDWTRVVMFLTEHYHLRNWSPSRDMDMDMDERCPLYLEPVSHEHLVWDCKRLEIVRRATLGRFLDRDGWNIA